MPVRAAESPEKSGFKWGSAVSAILFYDRPGANLGSHLSLIPCAIWVYYLCCVFVFDILF